MEIVLSKIKNNIEFWLLYFLIALIPFQIVLLPGDSLFSLPEFISPAYFSLYLGDLLIAILLLLQQNFKKDFEKNKYKLLIFFTVWIFLSILQAEYRGLAFFAFFKLLIFILFAVYIHKISQRVQNFVPKICSIVFISGLLQSTIGIWQFICQKSIGLAKLGEPILGKNLPGIAKLDFNGGKMIRAYGTFPHPNILGGFLLFSLVCGCFLYFQKIGDRKIFSIILIPQIICLILTFSRSAWLGLAAALLIGTVAEYDIRRQSLLVFIKKFKNLIIEKLLKIGNWKLKISILTLLIVIIVLYPLIKLRFIHFEKAMQDRKIFMQTAIAMIKKEPFLGIGWGNYLLRIKDFSPTSLEYWQYQPVHNIYLLIFAETGVIGLFFFLLLIGDIIKKSFSLIKNEPQKAFFLSVFIGFLVIGIFDHYFITIEHGQMMFWITAGLLSSL